MWFDQKEEAEEGLKARMLQFAAIAQQTPKIALLITADAVAGIGAAEITTKLLTMPEASFLLEAERDCLVGAISFICGVVGAVERLDSLKSPLSGCHC